jgi:HSP20 family protein
MLYTPRKKDRPGPSPSTEVTSQMATNSLTPLRDFMSLRDAMDRFFEDRWVSPGSWLTFSGAGTQSLPIDAYETPDDIVVRALVPGVKPDDIDVQYQNGMLTLRTKLEPLQLSEGASWLISEISAAQAVRQIALPRTVDAEHATTSFENGVLTLTLPKTPDAKPRQIKVGGTTQIGAGDKN